MTRIISLVPLLFCFMYFCNEMTVFKTFLNYLFQDKLRDVVLLVFANKQDLPNAMNATEITDKLGCQDLK